MARRHREAGPSLESDSFLDIVANIVGILIILIVVVGLRVGQSASAERQLAPNPPAPSVVAQSETTERTPAVTPVVAPRPQIVIADAPTPDPPKPSPKLLSSIAAAESELRAIRAEADSLQETSRRLDRRTITLTAQTEQLSAEQERLTTQLAAVTQESSELGVQVDELEAVLDGLSRQISDVPAEKVTVLHHRLNPLGREVRGEELHFRVAGGRVAHVPLKELIERLKPEIEREKEWIAKYHRHRGRVGPVDGFSLEFVVERQRLSVVEQLQQSAMMMRISVTGWKVVPGRELVGETAEAALSGDSAYLTALRLAEPGTTLTFWVYPDSFEAYRRLQEHAHATGFAVAARPLPHGVPIAGSPGGSRSSSQ